MNERHRALVEAIRADDTSGATEIVSRAADVLLGAISASCDSHELGALARQCVEAQPSMAGLLTLESVARMPDPATAIRQFQEQVRRAPSAIARLASAGAAARIGSGSGPPRRSPDHVLEQPCRGIDAPRRGSQRRSHRVLCRVQTQAGRDRARHAAGGVRRQRPAVFGCRHILRCSRQRRNPRRGGRHRPRALHKQSRDSCDLCASRARKVYPSTCWRGGRSS